VDNVVSKTNHAKMKTTDAVYATIIIQNRDGTWRLIHPVDDPVEEALASEYACTGSHG
jgi:hypothetical protein